MPLKSKALRTEQDLTPKQRKFIDILVANWGEITKGEAPAMNVRVIKIFLT